MDWKIGVIIPAFNEEKSIGKVLSDIPYSFVQEVVVVDNNSTDNTAQVAQQRGATVLKQPKRGYGHACLKGIRYYRNMSRAERPEIIVFLDGDYSDFPEELPSLVKPIAKEGVDLVIGSRMLGEREKGALLPQAVFGNWLATQLIWLFYGHSFTDLGPFRAIKFDRLLELNMQDKTFGWTVEMQVKAIKNGLVCQEVPVSYRQRIGHSKVTGTVKGTFMAGTKIIYTIFKHI